MKIDEIKELVDFILSKQVEEFEIEVEGLRLKLVKPKPEVRVVEAAQLPASQAVPQDTKKEKAEEKVHYITAPMIGTFYRAPDPSSPPFVKEGDHVNKGDVVCIIEAMKLMNEVEADVSGVIKEVLVENAQPVEFGQKLFAVIPDND